MLIYLYSLLVSGVFGQRWFSEGVLAGWRLDGWRVVDRVRSAGCEERLAGMAGKFHGLTRIFFCHRGRREHREIRI